MNTRTIVFASTLIAAQSTGGARSHSDVDLSVLYRDRQALATTWRLEEEIE